MQPSATEPPGWIGYYYDGRSAERQRVYVLLEAGGIRIARPDGSNVRWPFHAIRPARLVNETDHVQLETRTGLPQALIVQDPGFLPALRSAAPTLAASPAPERPGPKLAVLVGIAAAIPAIGLLAYFWLLPAIAGAAAGLVPKSWEDKLGEALVSSFAPEDQRCQDPRLHRALDQMVDRLSEAAPDSGYRFRVEVLNAPEVNALAAPGGHIVIFSGLIERTATPEELAAVLAHEIQHVLRRHSTRAILREMFLSLLIATAFGGGDLGQIVGTAQTLGSLHFARGQEEEADREGMRLLQAARIDPSAIVTMFEKLAEQSGDAPEFFQYLSSHPGTRRRIRVMEEMAREPAPPPRPLLPGINWNTLRTACSTP